MDIRLPLKPLLSPETPTSMPMHSPSPFLFWITFIRRHHHRHPEAVLTGFLDSGNDSSEDSFPPQPTLPDEN